MKSSSLSTCQTCRSRLRKTSTGFSTGGATIEDVELMREVVGPNMGLKQLEEHVPIKMRKLLLKQGLIGLEHLRVLR